MATTSGSKSNAQQDLPRALGIDVSEVDLAADIDSDSGLESQDGDTQARTERVGEFDLGNAPDELRALVHEAQNAWTRREKKDMIRNLKERGMIWWINEYAFRRAIPVWKLLYAFRLAMQPDSDGTEIPNEVLMPELQKVLVRELRQRKKLLHLNTVDDAVNLIRKSKRILILTGAGISVSCGIPDFRSVNGLYATIKENGQYDLDDPQQMFDMQIFRETPSIFYSFASQIYPSNFVPSPCHHFIKLIEDQNKLLRNYTQNIDTLESRAGVQRVLHCHGSFATASCIQCHLKVPGADIKDDIMAQRVPICSSCNPSKRRKPKKPQKKGWVPDWDNDSEGDEPALPPGIMKPDITFFHEKLSDKFEQLLFEDREIVDLLLIIGTSLKVTPVSEICTHLPHSVPQILINRTPVKHVNPDIVLLGDADVIVQYLCDRLQWQLPGSADPSRSTSKRRSPPGIKDRDEPQRVADSHVWLFKGADGGQWVEELRQAGTPSGPEARDIPALVKGQPHTRTRPEPKRARTR